MRSTVHFVGIYGDIEIHITNKEAERLIEAYDLVRPHTALGEDEAEPTGTWSKDGSSYTVVFES